MKVQNICVLGLGYIGLPTASLFATKGHRVIGVDINEAAVSTINRGEIHIYEPDLDILVKSAVNSGNLIAQTVPADADVFIIAVPTPFKEGHQPDISYVESATRAIAPYVKKGNLIILESTSPVGTTERVGDIIREMRKDLYVPRWKEEGNQPNQVHLVHCPERVLPGHILKELVDNDRIIGGLNSAASDVAKELYGELIRGSIFCTDSRTAELTKLSENSFRDVNIAFANELSQICDQLEIDVWKLIELANRHPRVKILKPGPGVGGHCIAVDPWFIVSSAPEHAKLIRTAREVNDHKPHYVAERVCLKAQRFRNPVIACLGLAYKADIDDFRESPAVEIVKMLGHKKVGKILVVEPHARELPSELKSLGCVELVSLSSALEQADIITLLVDHKEFLALSAEVLREKIVVDTRGIYR